MLSRLALFLGLLTLATNVFAAADLAVTLTTPSPSYPSGSTAVYTTAIRNDGPDPAAAVSVSIRFTALSGTISPSNIQVTGTPAGFTCGAPFDTAQGPTLTCTAASIPSGFTGQLVVSTTIGGTSGNMNVCSSIAPTATDSDTANNNSCVTTTVTVPQADLATGLTSPTPASVPSGTTATYTSTIRNDGPDAATNASLAVRFTSLNGNVSVANIQVTAKPPELTCGAPVATAQGPTVTCTAPSLPSGYTGQVTMTAQVNGTSGQLNVCASVASATQDPDTNGESNSACVLNTVTAAPPPASTSLSCPGTFGAGTTGNATVTISAEQGSNTTIALSSANTNVATVPPSVVILAGQVSASFQIAGTGAGTSVITATPPDGFGTAQSCTASVEARALEAQSVPTLSPLALLVTIAILAIAGVLYTRSA